MRHNCFLDMIDCEATKVLANAQCQKCLSGKDMVLQTTQTFLTNSCELYQIILKLISESEISLSE